MEGLLTAAAMTQQLQLQQGQAQLLQQRGAEAVAALAPALTLSTTRVLRYRYFTMELHMPRWIVSSGRVSEFDAMRAGLGAKCRREEDLSRNITSCFCSGGKRVIEIGISSKQSFGPFPSEDNQSLVFVFDHCKSNCSSSRDHHKSRLMIVVDDLPGFAPVYTCAFVVQAREKAKPRQPLPPAPAPSAPDDRDSHSDSSEEPPLRRMRISEPAAPVAEPPSQSQSDIASAVEATPPDAEVEAGASKAPVAEAVKEYDGEIVTTAALALDTSGTAAQAMMAASSALARQMREKRRRNGLSAEQMAASGSSMSVRRQMEQNGQPCVNSDAEVMEATMRAMLVMGVPSGATEGLGDQVLPAHVMVRVFTTPLNTYETNNLVAPFAPTLKALPGFAGYGWRAQPGFLITFSSYKTVESAQRSLLEVQRYLRNEGYENPFHADLHTSNLCCLISYCTSW
eukprot:m51a1_g2049 hypothetical protein (454) ;mRNA; r:1387016-1388505